MTTFADDVIRLYVDGLSTIFLMSELAMTWPPPEAVLIVDEAGKLRMLYRLSMSQIGDDERAALTDTIRGAVYVPRAEMDRAGFREAESRP